MISEKSISVLEVLQGASEFLKKHQIEQPRLNSEHLLAHLLEIPRLELYLQFDRPLLETILAPLRDLLRQRSKGTPLQHLLGTVDFFGRIFTSDARALIPRPETEQLLERALTYPNCHRIIDVGTGSGVIAITLALEKKDVSIEAIDVSAEALALAQENGARHQVTQIQWHLGNLLEPLSLVENRASFDLIIANLPYIPTGEIATLAKEVSHDPLLALDGGEDGLDSIRILIEQALGYLKSGGRLLLEIGKGQHEEILTILKKHHYHSTLALDDYQGVSRFIEAIRP